MKRLLITATGVVVVLLLVVHVALFNSAQQITPGIDALAYLAGAHAILAGTPVAGAIIPGGAPYIYPPLVALLYIPLTPLSFSASLWGSVVLTAISLLILTRLLAALVDWRVATIAVWGFVPAWYTLWTGQINAWIAIITLVALLATKRDKLERASACLILGCLLKITPGVALAFLSLRAPSRTIPRAVAVASFVVLATLPIVGLPAWWDGMLHAASADWSHPDFVSLTAYAARFPVFSPTLWTILISSTVFLATLLRVRRITPVWCIAAGTIIPLLIERIAWSHHAVLALPILALIWGAGQRGQILAALLWLAITIVGGWAIALSFTIMWLICLWPQMLQVDARPNWATHERSASCFLS